MKYRHVREMARRPGLVFLVSCALCLLTLARVHAYYGTIYKGWDAQFYYNLAASIVLDGDVDITNNLTATPHPSPFDRDGDGDWESLPRDKDGRIPTKYPIGTSLLEIPWLGVGSFLRGVCESFGVEFEHSAGYSAPEIWSVAIGLVMCFSLGLAMLYRMLLQEYGVAASIFGLVACWMGTSLFYYSAVFPFVSHGMSFVALMGVMWSTREIEGRRIGNVTFVWLGGCLGLLFLIRPQQILVSIFLIPILWKCVRRRDASCWLPGATTGVALIVAAIAAQVAVNYSQFGVLTASGYTPGGEGFRWLAPRFDIVLWSRECGLLVFSPVTIVAVGGWILYGRFIPSYVMPQLLNAVAQLYLVSAWSSPYQGDAFGCRMLSENAMVIAFALSATVSRLSGKGKWVVGVIVGGGVFWTSWLILDFVGFIA